jgi:hypothetical protein
MKAKLKVIIHTTTTQQSADEFVNSAICEYSTYVVVSVNIKQSNDRFQCTVVLATEYDATEFVLSQKSAKDVALIATYCDCKLTGHKLCNVPLTRKDVEKMIENEKIKDSFIKHNLDNLFENGTAEYRKTVFSNRNTPYYKQVYKKAKLNKTELIQKLLKVVPNFNYSDYAWEIWAYFN